MVFTGQRRYAVSHPQAGGSRECSRRGEANTSRHPGQFSALKSSCTVLQRGGFLEPICRLGFIGCEGCLIKLYFSPTAGALIMALSLHCRRR